MSEQGPTAEIDARLREDARLLLAKYQGRSGWVGYEGPRREAWREIEDDLRWLTRDIPPGKSAAEA